MFDHTPISCRLRHPPLPPNTAASTAVSLLCSDALSVFILVVSLDNPRRCMSWSNAQCKMSSPVPGCSCCCLVATIAECWPEFLNFFNFYNHVLYSLFQAWWRDMALTPHASGSIRCLNLRDAVCCELVQSTSNHLVRSVC